MSSVGYGARGANQHRKPVDLTIASGETSISTKSNRPKYRLYAAGTRNIATINCTNAGDGYELVLFVKSGSANITLVETDNIVVNSTSLVLGANDSVTLMYDKPNAKWVAIGNYNV